MNQSDHVVNETSTDIGFHPCTGHPRSLTESGVIHFTAFADGTVHLTGTLRGTFSLDVLTTKGIPDASSAPNPSDQARPERWNPVTAAAHRSQIAAHPERPGEDREDLEVRPRRVVVVQLSPSSRELLEHAVAGPAVPACARGRCPRSGRVDATAERPVPRARLGLKLGGPMTAAQRKIS